MRKKSWLTVLVMAGHNNRLLAVDQIFSTDLPAGRTIIEAQDKDGFDEARRQAAAHPDEETAAEDATEEDAHNEIDEIDDPFSEEVGIGSEREVALPQNSDGSTSEPIQLVSTLFAA